MAESRRAQIEAALARISLNVPRRVLERIFSRPTERDGYRLDPQMELILFLTRMAQKPLTHHLSLEAARADLEANAQVFAPVTFALAEVSDENIQGIRVRIYRPHGVSADAPALVYFHGGGWVCGSLDSHDAPCRVIANEARCVVLSVDYDLAPEHPFPNAADDAVTAFRAIASGARDLRIDPSRTAIGGDSAGGNLAAVVSSDTRADAVRPAFQLLFYPSVDATMSMRSIETLGHGFFLERETMDWYIDRYAPVRQERRHPRISPLWAADFKGLPPTLVVTAGFDPLRDEGEAYARALKDSGIDVAYRCYGSLFHGFINVAGAVDAARSALYESAHTLRNALAREQARL